MKKIHQTKTSKKRLLKILKKHSGRNNTGKITIRHRGGRQKRFYRVIDFLRRDKQNIKGKVIAKEYDPNRNVEIALIEYEDGERRYIICPNEIKIGKTIMAGDDVDIKPGNALPLKKIPLGIQVHNIELYPGHGGQMVRGAGTYAVVLAKENKYVHLKLPSGEIRRFFADCYATIGQLSNVEHKEKNLGKAGRKRLLGIRPTVRGTAQNPRSHPHGGGEGRVGEGMHPKSPWGKPFRGIKTRKRKPNKR